MNELILESEGLRIAIRAHENVDVWAVAQAAFKAAHQPPRGLDPTTSPLKVVGSPPPAPKRSGSAAEQMRQIAADLLSNGRSREQRELKKHVRAAGVRPDGLAAALKADDRFELDRNVMGNPIWRDRMATPPAAPLPKPDSEKPEWMRDRKVDPRYDPAIVNGAGQGGT